MSDDLNVKLPRKKRHTWRHRLAETPARTAIHRHRAKYKFRQPIGNMPGAVLDSLVAGDKVRARVGKDVDLVRLAELRLLLRTEAAFDLYVAMLRARERPSSVCDRPLRWLNRAVPVPKGKKPRKDNGGRYSDRQLATACRTLETAGLVEVVERRWRKDYPSAKSNQGRAVGAGWEVRRLVKGQIVMTLFYAPQDVLRMLLAMPRRGRPEGYRKPPPPVSQVAQGTVGGSAFFADYPTPLNTAFKPVSCNCVAVTPDLRSGTFSERSGEAAMVPAAPSDSVKSPEPDATALIAPEPEAPSQAVAPVVGEARRKSLGWGTGDLAATVGRAPSPVTDRWVWDGMNLRPDPAKPPLDPMSFIPSCTTPKPKQLKATDTPERLANYLVRVYRGAVERHTKRRVYAFPTGIRASHKQFKSLVAAARTLIEHQLTPEVWAWFALDRWQEGAKRSGTARQALPPITYMWSAKQIGEDHGWARSSCANVFTHVSLRPPEYWNLCARWQEVAAAVAGCPQENLDEVCDAFWPGRELAEICERIHRWGQAKMADLEDRAAQHDWFWEVG